MSELKEIVFNAMAKLPIRDFGAPGGELDHLRIREAIAAALQAIEQAGFVIVPKELPEEPGARYAAGDYSRRNWEAAIEDLTKSSI